MDRERSADLLSIFTHTSVKFQYISHIFQISIAVLKFNIRLDSKLVLKFNIQLDSKLVQTING